LIKVPRFHFPGKKALLKEENQFEALLIEVSESLRDILKTTIHSAKYLH
jgi:hypothetical protein